MHKPTVLVGVTDHLDPELQAMLLAQYSRSYGSIVERAPSTPEKIEQVKSRMKQIYNGDSLAKNYGHKSVGQLGHTTIFFEGISMLAAIAIEVSELFNGQESSTRYIPYDNQPAVDAGNDLVCHWQGVWRLFYKSALEKTVLDLKQQYPQPEGSTATVYERTIKARAFDICGGLLPAGFTTCVGFTGSFDVLNDHLVWMAHHPLEELRTLARTAAAALLEKYPNAAFIWDKIRERGVHMLYEGWHCDNHVEAYYYRRGSFEHETAYSVDTAARAMIMRQHLSHDEAVHQMTRHYPIVDQGWHQGRATDVTLACQYWDKPSFGSTAVAIDRFADRLRTFGSELRKKYQAFPRPLSNALRFRLSSVMDFRSYRDVHRHRNGCRPLPLLSMELGPHFYYLDNLPFELRKRFTDLFHQQRQEFQEALDTRSTEAERNQLRLEQQYAIPMATQVPYYYECDLNQLLYMIELRTDKTVHQTVRIEMMAALDQFQAIFPRVKVHADLTPNNFTLKRGTQTFADVK